MTKWRQIGGDMTWETYGIVLGKNEPSYRQVHLVRVTPWLEHDKEAAVTHGLYLVDEKTVDHDDLDVARPEVRGALKSAGMDPDEYEALEPEHKAELLASYAGYDESRSVDRLAEALPDAPEDIAFWGQRETSQSLDTYDQEMRRAALEANFDTRLTFGEMPPADALEFALGGEGLEMELQGQDALAFEYATTLAGVSGGTDSAEALVETVRALVDAPPPADLDPETVDSGVERVLAEWERRYGDPSDEEDGVAAAAQGVASGMMSALGFEWI